MFFGHATMNIEMQSNILHAIINKLSDNILFKCDYIIFSFNRKWNLRNIYFQHVTINKMN